MFRVGQSSNMDFPVTSHFSGMQPTHPCQGPPPQKGPSPNKGLLWDEDNALLVWMAWRKLVAFVSHLPS